jgi:hypothetical protein
MKFTKKDISDIKYYFQSIKNRLEISKIYEDKKTIPEFIKINLIKYGILTGRIIEIIHRRINFKDENKNLNADELIKELYGGVFYKWLCVDNKKFIYGNNYHNNNNNIIDNTNNH